jgi:hypothetical protein
LWRYANLSTAPTATPTPVPATPTPTPTVSAVALFVETFDNNTGLDRFDTGVWHRDPYLVEQNSWPGDHGPNCEPPEQKRIIHRNNPSESFYLCADHMMTSVGDTSGYSVAWFSPDQVFADVTEISFDVNLTDLGSRQWWKVGVVTDRLYGQTRSTCCGTRPAFVVSDVDAADTGTSLNTPDLFIATWGGGLSGGYPGGLKIGNSNTGASANPTPNDIRIRHPATLRDNGNGTVTFTVAGVSATRQGSFPEGPLRVVFYDHNYTPTKPDPASNNDSGLFTWHWDNIIIR